MEKSSFFNAELIGNEWDRTYTAEDYATYFGSFIGNGVFPNPSSGLQVISNTDDMNITVKPGKAWINGYMYYNTDNLVLKIEPADGVLKRIDRIVIRLDFINREIKCYVKKGNFASDPISPTLQRDEDMYELAIADILVENGVISIQQSKITDTRLDSEVCGIVTQTVETIDTTDLYNKLQAYIDERGQDVKYWMDKATTQWEIDFNTWFETIKDILSGDVAGELANRILELENKVGSGLTADNILMPDGSSVETSILNNTSLANQALTRANEAFQRGDNVKKQLVDKLISEGLDVSTNNSFEELINNVTLGKKWASGSATFISTTISFNYVDGSKFNSGYIELSNIGFKPSVVISSYSNKTTKDLLSVLYSPTNAYYTPCVKYVVGTYGTGELTGNNRNIKADSKVYVNNSLIRIPCPWDSGSNTWEWIAFE